MLSNESIKVSCVHVLVPTVRLAVRTLPKLGKPINKHGAVDYNRLVYYNNRKGYLEVVDAMLQWTIR
jgi:hypothetical protein